MFEPLAQQKKDRQDDQVTLEPLDILNHQSSRAAYAAFTSFAMKMFGSGKFSRLEIGPIRDRKIEPLRYTAIAYRLVPLSQHKITYSFKDCH